MDVRSELGLEPRECDEFGHWVDPVMRTESGWKEDLAAQGHVPFVLDNTEYFVFPLGEHKYGLNTWREMKNGGFPKWKFDSEEDLLNAKIFNGHSIRERLKEIKVFEEY